MSQGNEITINILSESFERRRKTSGTESLNSWRNTWLVVTFSVFPFEIQSIDFNISTPWRKRKMEEWDTHLLPSIHKISGCANFCTTIHTRNESLLQHFFLSESFICQPEGPKSQIHNKWPSKSNRPWVYIPSHDVIMPKENKGILLEQYGLCSWGW